MTEYKIKIDKGECAYATVEILADERTIFHGNVPIDKKTIDEMWKQGISVEIENRDEYYKELEEKRKDKAYEKRMIEMKNDAYEYLADYLVKNNYIKQYIQIKKASHNLSDEYPYTVGFDVNLYTLVEAYAYEFIGQGKCKSCINLNPRRRSDNFYITTSILDDIAKNVNEVMSNDLYEPFFNKFDMITEKQLDKYQQEMYINHVEE
jgi:hypothetical protein